MDKSAVYRRTLAAVPAAGWYSSTWVHYTLAKQLFLATSMALGLTTSDISEWAIKTVPYIILFKMLLHLVIWTK